MERRSLSAATAVSAVCRGIADYLVKTHGEVIRQPVDLNYNFYDPEEYPPRDPSTAKGPMVVSYMGAMYGNRSPHQFFEGMRAFIDKSGIQPEQLRFRWAGSIAGITDINEIIERNGVRPYIDFLGQISHRAALQELLRSTAALIIQAPGDAIHIPGKLFEAMGARVPILALAHPCEVTEIMDRCRGGIACPHTKESVSVALGQFYERHQQGRPWDYYAVETARFSAEESVSKLAALFNRVSG
jgi:glycosyltransferase involved in cell wall biosynthesis